MRQLTNFFVSVLILLLFFFAAMCCVGLVLALNTGEWRIAGFLTLAIIGSGIACRKLAEDLELGPEMSSLEPRPEDR